ncbi:tyrosine-type recombinase/integrase [Aliiruegeria lutimaris]|uniref:Tyr recombinase domain-containing protein n=1 Tax=Aliiruegeria lutimaris TaxID=571298 RepID=A0A1G9AJN3_9RHOB|nr:site-specific integrase [Aliiruegeria lutimaris]SDK27491.1 protein of unknown function [Aliiruegeria lutimaris]
MNLTDPKIRRLKDGEHMDGRGLYLRVRGDAKLWMWRYSLHGRRQRMSLGSYPAVSLLKARQKRDEAAALVAAGSDPTEAREARGRLTLADVIDLTFEARKAGLKGDGTAGRWMSPLKVHVLPKLGHRDVESITQADVAETLRPVWRTKTSASEKAIQRLGQALRHAEAAGYDVDPRVIDRAKVMLGDQGHRVTHHPAMPWQDLPEFFASLGDKAGDRALKFLILTASRSTPVRHAHADQIEDDVWTVPAELMKARKTKAQEFRVPLALAALELVREDGLLFPGQGGKVMSDMTLTAVLRRRGQPFVPHGFRSSFRDWSIDNGADGYVAEMVLAHAVGSKAQQAYARSSAFERRRALMHRWADFVTGQAGANVVQIPG